MKYLEFSDFGKSNLVMGHIMNDGYIEEPGNEIDF
jgi:hypothetical protein